MQLQLRVLVALLVFAPFIHALPVDDLQPASDLPVRSTPEPGTLLGRRYSLQNHGPLNSDISGPLTPRYRSSHQGTRRRSTPFPKYLADRAAVGHTRRQEGADVDYVSYVGDTPHGPPEAPKPTGTVARTPSTYAGYDTSVTLIPRPTGTAEAKHAESATSKHPKIAAAKTIAHSS